MLRVLEAMKTCLEMSAYKEDVAGVMSMSDFMKTMDQGRPTQGSTTAPAMPPADGGKRGQYL